MQNNAASDPPHDPAYPHPGDTFQTAGSTSNANASPGSGSNLVPVAAVRAQVQEPPPPAAGLPHAMLPNTLLVPARWPALLMESLAPAAPGRYYNSTATTPAAYGSLPNICSQRERFMSVAEVRSLAAQESARRLGPNPDETATAMRALGSPANVPSRTYTQISTAAGLSPAITHARSDAVAVGSGQTPGAAVESWQASVGKDDSASDADKRAVVGVESDDTTKAAVDDAELSSEDESEEYEAEDEDDEEEDEDDVEDDDQQDEEDDEEEGVRLRLRVTSPMHRHATQWPVPNVRCLSPLCFICPLSAAADLVAGFAGFVPMSCFFPFLPMSAYTLVQRVLESREQTVDEAHALARVWLGEAGEVRTLPLASQPQRPARMKTNSSNPNDPSHNPTSLRPSDAFQTAGTAPNDNANPATVPEQCATTDETRMLDEESPLSSTTPLACQSVWLPALATPNAIRKLRAATPAGLVSRAYANAEDYSKRSARKTAAAAVAWPCIVMLRAGAEDTGDVTLKPDASTRTSLTLSPAWPAPRTATSAAAPVSQTSDGSAASTVVSRDHGRAPAVGDETTVSPSPPTTPCMHGRSRGTAGNAADHDAMRGTEEVGTVDNDRRTYTTIRLYAGYYLAHRNLE